MIVYLLRNRANGKGYVGLTTQRLSDRLTYHRSESPGRVASKKNTAIWRAILKYGWDTFDVSVIEECVSIEALKVAETAWIRELGTLSPRGYNLNEGGFCRIPSAETRARISAASKGRKVSAEVRAKISAALTGRVITWGSKISAARVGSRPNEAQAEALRRGREGRWVGDNRMRARTHNPNRKISLEDDTEIRRLRAEEGWTQQRLADKFGLSQPYVGKLLRSPVLVMEDCSTCGGDGRVPCPEVFREPGCGPGCYTCKGVGSVPCPEEAE